jgi:hypothetical protein
LPILKQLLAHVGRLVLHFNRASLPRFLLLIVSCARLP